MTISSFRNGWHSFATTLCLFGLVLHGSAAHADQGGPENTLIIYTGTGYISDATQPHLAKLLTSPESRYADPGEKMIEKLDRAVRTEIGDSQLRKWTRHPIVSTADEIDAVLSKRLGREATAADRERVFEIFDEVYALMFVGGFEYTAVQQTSFGDAAAQLAGIEAEPLWHQYSYVGMSALVFDMKRSEVIASTSALGLTDATFGEATLQVSDPAGPLAEAYVNGGVDSLKLLGNILKRMSPGKRRKNADLPRYVVTNGWLDSGAGPALALFGWAPAQKPGGLLCERPTQCAEGDKTCNQLMDLMVHGMTAALSRAGLLTEPPLSSHWRAGAAESALVQLSLSRLQSSPIELRALKIPQQANSADIKIVPTLEKSLQSRRTIKSGIQPFEVNIWMSELSYVRAITDPQTCRIETAEKAGKRAVGTSEGLSFAPGTVSVSAEQDRLQAMVAVFAALSEEMPKHLEAEGRK